MKKARLSDNTLLVVAQHPFSSAQQIARMTGERESALAKRLFRLRSEGFVETLNPKEPVLSTRSLHLSTSRGLAHLAELQGISPQEVAKALGLSRQRLCDLAVRVETTYQARQVLLGLARTSSVLSGWRCMARIPTGRGPLLLDGAATFKYQGRLIQLALELDSGERAERQVRKLYEARGDYPALQLGLVCWSARSMQRYLDLLRGEALALGVSPLPTYATLGSAIVDQSYDAPIWYSNYDKCYTGIFQAQTPAERIVQPWPPPEAGSFKNVLSPSITELATLAADACFRKATSRRQKLAGYQFALSPLQKRIIDLVASHPLLNETDLAALSGVLPASVRPAVEELLRWGLLSAPKEDELGRKCLKLTSLGIAYLAHRQGWGSAVKSYARARGWKLDGEGQLVLSKMEKDFDHTRQINSLLVRLSSNPHVQVVSWTSEPSTTCRFFSGGRWRWLKPDASGRLRVMGKASRLEVSEPEVPSRRAPAWKEYPFVLEWERTRTTLRKLRAKILQYYRWYLSGYHRTQAPSVTVLMVTTGRRRVETIIAVARQLAEELSSSPLPLLVTSYKELTTRGPLAPIWRNPSDGQPGRLARGPSSISDKWR